MLYSTSTMMSPESRTMPLITLFTPSLHSTHIHGQCERGHVSWEMEPPLDSLRPMCSSAKSSVVRSSGTAHARQNTIPPSAQGSFDPCGQTSLKHRNLPARCH